MDTGKSYIKRFLTSCSATRAWLRSRASLGLSTVYGTTVVSSESGHVTVFQRSGTCVCGEGTFRIFGPKTISAVMLSQWENGAFLFKLIATAKLFMLLQRYDLAHVQN